MAKKLENWQVEDARRLKALFEERAEQSQLAFGATYEIGNQSMVSQYLLGIRPLNIVAATKFAKGLCVTIDDFSPTLADQIRAAWYLTAAGLQHAEGQPQFPGTSEQTHNLSQTLDKELQKLARDERAEGRQRRRPK
ncbi:hypothetical protein [Bordetella bronchiseptica]|uniref:hypothetical protein n=1 Tax=Bordetella bronchiseptica TaxID=518 RepID=UPI000460B587|nr:hypothetical protein [Bordetella bronchiseptica]KDC48037.1 hypothetical protein L509_4160 [Bordetella bronchiseptica M85/00/2]